jgi:hypothetical protein
MAKKREKKVYVLVTNHDYEGDTVEGVTSKKKVAEAWKKVGRDYSNEYHEFVLDKDLPRR